MKSRFFALILAMAMFLIIIGGCSEQQTHQESEPTTPSESTQQSSSPMQSNNQPPSGDVPAQPAPGDVTMLGDETLEKPVVPMTEPEPDWNLYPINDDSSITLNYIGA